MPLSSLLPGPHDPYNASSVKLAEATRIRLVLPGLSAPEKEEPTLLNRANSSKLQAEAAAAKEKARKKLLKIQGIASQADKAQSAVIIDAVVLESEEDTDVDEASCSCTEQGNEAAAGSGAFAGNNSNRTRRQGNAPTAGQYNSNYSPTTGGASGGGKGVSGRAKKHGFRASGDGTKPSSRLAVPSPRVTSDNETTSAGVCAASTRAPAGSSGKPYVPIWDRLPSTPAEEKRPQATTQRVLQPVAIKTFSPTLGSLGQNINQDATYRPTGQEVVPLRSVASGRIRKSTTPAASDQPRYDSSSQNNRTGGAVASELQGLRNKSRSFTAGHQHPNQLL